MMRRAAATPVRWTTSGAIWAGGIPISVSVSANRVSRATTTISPAQARPSPPAIAAPWTSMIVTCGSSLTAWNSLPASRLNAATSSCMASPSTIERKPLMSPPAQNTSPLPRNVTPRMVRSSRTASTTAARSSAMSAESAFRASGRFSHMVSHPSSRSSRSVAVSGRLRMHHPPRPKSIQEQLPSDRLNTIDDGRKTALDICHCLYPFAGTCVTDVDRFRCVA